MPTITLDLKDLKELSRLSLTQSELNAALSSVKCEVESVAGSSMTIEVTSDRPDLFSCEGIARAIRQYICGSGDLKIPVSRRKPFPLHVDPSVSGIRPYIVASALLGIKLNDEALKQAMQLQEKLHSTYGLKRRKASIGVYDLDKVRGDFIYECLPPEKISFVPLDAVDRLDGMGILEKTMKGKEYADIIGGLKRFPLLRDSQGNVLSMPPIINSELTRVTEKSRNLLIDVTGTEEKAINLCLNVMVTSLLERGGSIGRVNVYYGKKQIGTPKLNNGTMKLNRDKIYSTSGLQIDLKDAVRLLSRMGFRSRVLNKNTLEATIPPYRFDIMHQVDLVEDIIMAYGLDNITPEYPKTATIGKPLVGSRLKHRVRDLMVGMGFQEIATYMLGSQEVLDKSLFDEGPHVEITKPLSSEYAIIRGALAPKILQFLGNNVHCAFPQKVFEYGDVVKVESGHPVSYTHLAAAISDYKISFEDIQAVAVSLFKNLSKEVKFSATVRPPFIEGRAAEIMVEGKNIGVIGEVLPKVLVGFGIESPVGALEIDMSSMVPLESLFLG